MNVSQIGKYVTHFSEELEIKGEHFEEVTIGGRITSVVPPLGDGEPMYIIVIDDHVGATHALVSSSLYESSPNDFALGEYLFLNGFLSIMERNIKDEIVKDCMVFAYKIKNINRNGDIAV